MSHTKSALGLALFSLLLICLSTYDADARGIQYKDSKLKLDAEFLRRLMDLTNSDAATEQAAADSKAGDDGAANGRPHGLWGDAADVNVDSATTDERPPGLWGKDTANPAGVWAGKREHVRQDIDPAMAYWRHMLQGKGKDQQTN